MASTKTQSDPTARTDVPVSEGSPPHPNQNGSAPDGHQPQTDGQRQATNGQAATADVPERPALAPNIVMSGEMEESGFAEPQWMVQRDGQFIHLTELLYHVTEQVDGQRNLDEIATAMSEKIDRDVTADNVRQLIGTKLIPLGVVVGADGKVIGADAAGEGAVRSPLKINMKTKVLPRGLITPLTKVLKILFFPPILIAMLLVCFAVQGWLFFVHGIASSIHEAVYKPWVTLVVLGIIVVGTAWHEFGHAAALEYGGGEVRGMGAGFYLVYPAFYTDVTDNYRRDGQLSPRPLGARAHRSGRVLFQPHFLPRPRRPLCADESALPAPRCAPHRCRYHPSMPALRAAGWLLDAGGHHRHPGLLLVHGAVPAQRAAAEKEGRRRETPGIQALGEGRLRDLYPHHRPDSRLLTFRDAQERAAHPRERVGLARPAMERAVRCGERRSLWRRRARGAPDPAPGLAGSWFGVRALLAGAHGDAAALEVGQADPGAACCRLLRDAGDCFSARLSLVAQHPVQRLAQHRCGAELDTDRRQ